MIDQILKMIPRSAFESLPDKVGALITRQLSQVELAQGERAAVLLIEGRTGYMVNIIRLDGQLNMEIVRQTTLAKLIDDIIKLVKDGEIK